MSTVPEVTVAAHSGLKVLRLHVLLTMLLVSGRTQPRGSCVEGLERVKGDFEGLLKATLLNCNHVNELRRIFSKDFIILDYS